MKKIILLIVSLIQFTILFGQQTGMNTYVLRFTDKGVSPDFVINASLYLSQKAIERRIKYQIPVDQTDLPLREQYVNDVSSTGARILARSRWFNTIVIEADTNMIINISALSCISKVELLIYNSQAKHVASETSSPFFKAETVNPWQIEMNEGGPTDKYNYGTAYNQINQLKGQYLHNLGFSGEGMLIAVIDAGFSSADIMPCFDSLRANKQIKGTRDFAQLGNNIYATSMATHGTSVLSCMGANVSGKMVGTAPKADYWLLRSEVYATESITEEYFWVSAAEFADSVGADLINSSLGYTTFDNASTNHSYSDLNGNTTMATIGADKAASKGILVVNSAGNSGGAGWWYIGAPADGDSVFTIGAVNSIGVRASFSSVGPTSDGRIKPTVMGQGSGAALYSPGGLTSGSGTSFSSPIICGITACLWQALPELNNMQIIDIIKSTSSQASNPDSLMGWGIPNYETAYTTLSIRDHIVTKSLIVYPNPVYDKITLAFPAPIQGKYKIEIVNIEGTVVYSNHRSESSVHSIQINDIGSLPPGIYLLKVSGVSLVYTGKIIKM